MAKFILDTRMSEASYVLCMEAIRRGIIEPEDLNENLRTMAEQRHFWNNQPPLAAFPNPNAPHIKEGRQNQAIDVQSNKAKALARFYESYGVDVAFNVPGESWHMDVLSDAQVKAAAVKIRKERDAAVLERGERHRSVSFIKYQLQYIKDKNGRSYFAHGEKRPDGGFSDDFTEKLEQAVKKFQRDRGLTPDGKFGAATNRKLDLVYGTQKRKRVSAKKRAEARKRLPTKVSPEFIEFLASWEGLELEAYQVPGENFWTIGVGHARTLDGKPIRKGQKITKEKALAVLKSDLDRFEKAVIKLVPERWRDQQREFETCVSLAFNMGEEILTASAPLTSFAVSLKKPATPSNKRHAGAQILLYNKGGQPLRVMPGLVRRRKAEQTLWLTGKYNLNN